MTDGDYPEGMRGIYAQKNIAQGVEPEHEVAATPVADRPFFLSIYPRMLDIFTHYLQ